MKKLLILAAILIVIGVATAVTLYNLYPVQMAQYAGMARNSGKVKPGTTSYAMFSIMDFFPTFAHLIGAKVPIDRPIDGVDQTDVLFGKNETGNRDSLLTFVGADMVAVRWKQWRMYFTDVHPTGIGPQRQPGMFSASAPMAGYPKVYNIEMDPHENLQVGALFGWTVGPALEAVEKYRARRVQGPDNGRQTAPWADHPAPRP